MPRKRAENRLITSLVFTLVLFVLTASSVLSAELDTVRANYSAPTGGMAPLWLAQDGGLFEKYALALDLKYVLPGTATQALLSKSLDIVNPGPQLLEAALAGEKVVFIVGVLNRAVLSLYSKPEIGRFSDLRGKVLGVTQPGSTTDFTARILLREVGMVPGKDVRILHLKGVPEIMASLLQGTIDAGILSAPTTLKARQAGLRELVDITDKNIALLHAGLATTREYGRDHRDRVLRFLQGYLEGLKIARTDPNQTKQVISKYTRVNNPEALEETYRTFLKAWERIPYVSTAGVQTLLRFASHPAARSADAKQFIDNSFLEELERSGFVDRLYQR